MVVSLIEVVIANDILTIVFRSGIFALMLAFGILLIRSVRKEIEEREKIQVLAKQLQEANVKLDLRRIKMVNFSSKKNQKSLRKYDCNKLNSGIITIETPKKTSAKINIEFISPPFAVFISSLTKSPNDPERKNGAIERNISTASKTIAMPLRSFQIIALSLLMEAKMSPSAEDEILAE